MNVPSCRNPFCKGRSMKRIDVRDAWSFVCPRCHAVLVLSTDKLKAEKAYERDEKRRTQAEELFRRQEKKKTIVALGS